MNKKIIIIIAIALVAVFLFGKNSSNTKKSNSSTGTGSGRQIDYGTKNEDTEAEDAGNNTESGAFVNPNHSDTTGNMSGSGRTGTTGVRPRRPGSGSGTPTQGVGGLFGYGG